MEEVESVIEVKNLKAYIPIDPRTEINPVNDVSFSINKGEIVALVGESGSGKSVTALSIMGLNSPSIKYHKESAINFEGKNLMGMGDRNLRTIRGNDISMIFQDPMFSLNPVHKIGKQISEALILHKNVIYKKVKNEVYEILNKVGVSDPGRQMDNYPHQLSGGMRQRVMIAMALICQPSLLIADEPTTALDVTIQAQILDIMKNLQKDTDLSMLLITHDLGVVAEMADRILVMYSGKVVEEGDAYSIFKQPLHPYTEGLMSSIPTLEGESEEQLEAIPGTVPNPSELPKGCNFYGRCKYGTEKCKEQEPILEPLNGNRVSCWYPLKGRNDMSG
ncbi:ABC transporter ATP-binding protein [Salicibibacter kimchii]|uniref:ABC transporter ATP-binding protein n=1 Tax=Salicibibacter kimchii TaxID=2099786 RepID=A0A345BWP4_9BACI|nr:ABC transporter ATP-binding protein [Salicibibacter kimchii]AXF55375.1 ABC transporter ATP-binding protein [Salicibibacter kimchii]